MLRKRILIGLGGCFLASGAAWADGVAYVDCASHPETTLVFGKPRRTPETVAAIACGERFTILQYGFIFSRVQTKDGQVGYVYSNLISADRSGAAVPQSATRVNAAPAAVPTATTTVAAPNPTPAAQSQAASIQQAPVEAPAVAVIAPKAAGVTVQPSVTLAPQTQVTAVQAGAASPTQTQVSAVQPVPAPRPATSSSATETPATIVSPSSGVSEQLHTAPAPSTSTETAAPAASVAESPTKAAAEATPTEATPAAQPEAAPAEPAAPPIRAVRARESWERPNSGGRRLVPLFDLFGGYGFARFDNGAGASASNLNGVIGSFGWNVKPWLQIVADSSYNFVTVSGVKSVMYGNHWGPRIFYRGRNRWGLTPFVEGLVGGTRADITVPGAGGYTTSQNVLSYKVGGGLDMKLSRKIEIRLIDVDYYRTSFGANLYQNNYWASAGIVLRLFGGSE